MKIDFESGRIAKDAFERTAETRPGKPSGKGDFAASLTKAVHSVEGTAKAADQTANDFVAGHVDIHEAMLAMEKADLVLKMGATIKAKMIDAYQKLLSSGG